MFAHLIQMLATYAGVTGARLHEDEEGVTAIEYGLIAALVAVVIIAGATALGVSLDGVFNFLSGEVSSTSTG